MNILLKNAVFINQTGQQYEMESFFIPARQIRYVHIPAYVSTNVNLQHIFPLLKYLNTTDNRLC